MLTRMRIVNFQKHKDLRLEFDTINVITGATDSGKTSVLRALLWALTNNAAGANVHNYGADNCRVEVEVDGHHIVRDWDKTTNAYIMDGREFLAFRTTVPKPIAELLNISGINIQERRDLPFMVYYTASDCANQFSEMLELNEIDDVIRNANKAVKAKDGEVSKYKSLIKDTEKALRNKSDLNTALAELNDIHKKRKEYINTSNSLKRLKDVLERYNRTAETVTKYKQVPAATDALRALDELCTEYSRSVSSLDKLKCIIAERTEVLHDGSKYADVDAALDELSRVQLLCDAMNAAEVKLSGLKDTLVTYTDAKRSVLAWGDRCTQLTLEYNTAMPEICPLCGAEQRNGCVHDA